MANSQRAPQNMQGYSGQNPQVFAQPLLASDMMMSYMDIIQQRGILPVAPPVEGSRKAQQGFVDNWQGEQDLANCNLHMLNTEDSCDVSFRVGGERQLIKAHRYVLISRSCVFHSMFTGLLAEKSEVDIPDIEAEEFKSFLLYLYTHNTTVNADNVTALLYSARKYAVTRLENQCRNFLSSSLSVENACTILEAAHRFDDEELYNQAFQCILEDGNQAVKSPGFLELSQEHVSKISRADGLNVEEQDLFEAVNQWTESECRRKGMEISSNMKRFVLGDVIANIRFSSMEPAFLCKQVKDSGLLSDSERLSALESIHSGELAQNQRRYAPRYNQGRRPLISYRRTVRKAKNNGYDLWQYYGDPA